MGCPRSASGRHRTRSTYSHPVPAPRRAQIGASVACRNRRYEAGSGTPASRAAMMNAVRSMCGCTNPILARLSMDRTQRCDGRGVGRRLAAGLVPRSVSPTARLIVDPFVGRAGSVPTCCPCRRSATFGARDRRRRLRCWSPMIRSPAARSSRGALRDSLKRGSSNRLRFGGGVRPGPVRSVRRATPFDQRES